MHYFWNSQAHLAMNGVYFIAMVAFMILSEYF